MLPFFLFMPQVSCTGPVIENGFHLLSDGVAGRPLGASRRRMICIISRWLVDGFWLEALSVNASDAAVIVGFGDFSVSASFCTRIQWKVG